ncbi:MAG TPA: hypothetical protein VMS31_15075 [Pyrinomonadaceae bacterium]|nr:hypothetical protein [Pyrinomonadaceae bacterium]
MAKHLTLEKNIIASIASHLLASSLLPPTTDVNELSGELTQVVFDQLQEAGIDLATWTKASVAEKRSSAHAAS